MAPRLQVLAGTSHETMVPITSLVNTTQSHKLSSDDFEGEIVVNIKGFVDPVTGIAKHAEYFARADRSGITWSIQVRGRFLTPQSADDVLFGNTFDRPLTLPWGSAAVFKFMQYIDPTLEHDLTSSTKPWALSPLIATIPHLEHVHVPTLGRRLPSGSSDSITIPPDENAKAVEYAPSITDISPFPPPQSIADDTSHLYLTLRNTNSSDGSLSGTASSSTSSISSTLSASPPSSVNGASGFEPQSSTANIGEERVSDRCEQNRSLAPLIPKFENASQRRSYFSTGIHRQSIQFGPEDVITLDFCYGFLEFHPTLALRLPGGLSFDLMRYWDGQPVRFVCCKRRSTDGEDPWGTIFWCVSIEMGEDASYS